MKQNKIDEAIEKINDVNAILKKALTLIGGSTETKLDEALAILASVQKEQAEKDKQVEELKKQNKDEVVEKFCEQADLFKDSLASKIVNSWPQWKKDSCEQSLAAADNQKEKKE